LTARPAPAVRAATDCGMATQHHHPASWRGGRRNEVGMGIGLPHLAQALVARRRLWLTASAACGVGWSFAGPCKQSERHDDMASNRVLDPARRGVCLPEGDSGARDRTGAPGGAPSWHLRPSAARVWPPERVCSCACGERVPVGNTRRSWCGWAKSAKSSLSAPGGFATTAWMGAPIPSHYAAVWGRFHESETGSQRKPIGVFGC
jgi:hypothetical protein